MKHHPVLFLMLLLFVASCAKYEKASFEDTPYEKNSSWYKGNTHTHTTNSDGDSLPAVVARWYRDNGYDFLVLSDHNVITDPDEVLVIGDSFLLIPGEEVSATFRDPFIGTKPIHINALNLKSHVKPVNEHDSIVETIQENVDAIRDAEGVPHINHPNFRWAFSHQELFQVEGYNLLEIYNGHPLVNNDGNEEHAGMEEIWDILLTSGKRIYGIGVDDAHHFKEFAPNKSNPGRCWVMVNADSLDTNLIMESLESGNFYFTTGPTIEEIKVIDRSYIVKIESDYTRIEFIGANGLVLKETRSNPARYSINGTEQYVRAKVFGADGEWAWTQPAFIEDLPTP